MTLGRMPLRSAKFAGFYRWLGKWEIGFKAERGKEKTGLKNEMPSIRIDGPCFFKVFDPFLDTFFAVCFFPFIKDVVDRDIRIGSVILQIFHESVLILTKFMEDGIFFAVEVQRGHMVFFAQLDIEGRGRFDPFSIEIELRIPMIDKAVRTDKFQKLRRGQVVANRGKAHPGWNFAGPSQGAKKPGFADAKAAAGIENIAGPVMFRKVKGIIRIVPDAVPDTIEEFYRLGNRIFFSSFYGFISIFDNGRMIAVDDRCG
jgi:hypothetical protein